MSQKERAAELRVTITEALFDYFKDSPDLKLRHMSDGGRSPMIELSDPEVLADFDASNVLLESTGKRFDGDLRVVFSCLRTDGSSAKIEYRSPHDLFHIVTAYVIKMG